MRPFLLRFLTLLFPLVAPIHLPASSPAPSRDAERGTALWLPSIFSDNMVLQRDQPIRIYGISEPDAAVVVDFRTAQSETTADHEGHWEVLLDPQEASFDPAELIVESGRESLRFRNVLVGEVWLASGQSNMAWHIGASADPDINALLADNPAIRLFEVPRKTATHPLRDADAHWVVSTPRSSRNFSAVAHAFGRDLQAILKTPIGLIEATWGGTPAIAWTRESVFDQHPLLRERADEWETLVANYDQTYREWQKSVREWKRANDIVVYHEDTGIPAAAEDFPSPDFDHSGWQVVNLPASFESLFGDVDGTYWFRRTIGIPEAFVGRDLEIHLGRIDDFDVAFFNGHRIGGMDDASTQPWNLDRVYEIPSKFNQSPTATIAVRVFDRYGRGGLVARDPTSLRLGPPSSDDSISLAGEWSAFPERPLKPATGPFNLTQLGAPREPASPDSPHRPASLANGMIAPVAPFTLRGVIWYQGENDAGWAPQTYDQRLRLMIEDWRSWWQLPEMPFGIVQLANFLEPKSLPSNDPWPILRESQRRLARDLPNIGLAVTIDLGEGNDIHPRDKVTVGRRLARWALADVYGILEVRGGPEIFRAERDGPSIILTFTQTGGGLHAFDRNELGGFTVAGPDGQFIPAQATILNRDQVRVQSQSLDNPVTVRYAWQNNPVDANLYSVERLPASPFEISVIQP